MGRRAWPVVVRGNAAGTRAGGEAPTRPPEASWSSRPAPAASRPAPARGRAPPPPTPPSSGSCAAAFPPCSRILLGYDLAVQARRDAEDGRADAELARQ